LCCSKKSRKLWSVPGIRIIEGSDDYRFWVPRVAKSAACELVVGNGKPGVEKTLIRLDQRGFRGALGIVDDDFDRPQGRPVPSANLLATDAHDLECLLLRSPALDGVLAEYSDPVRVRRFEQAQGTRVREALLVRGLPFGHLRWLAQRTAWPGAFDPLKPTMRSVNQRTWEVDQNALYDLAVEVGLAKNRADLGAAIAALPSADPWAICQGHDLIDLLNIGLHGVLGGGVVIKGLGPTDIAALLRQSFDRYELEKGVLGQGIRGWEKANPPYRILPTLATT
jgi:hypothetical protein